MKEAVPAVLDGVGAAVREVVGDGGPAVAEAGLVLDDGGVLLGRPAPRPEVRLQLLVVPLPALPPGPPRHLHRDALPVIAVCSLGPKLTHGVEEQAVLVRGPRDDARPAPLGLLRLHRRLRFVNAGCDDGQLDL